MKLTKFDLPMKGERMRYYLESGNIEYIILTLAEAWNVDPSDIERDYKISANRVRKSIVFNSTNSKIYSLLEFFNSKFMSYEGYGFDFIRVDLNLFFSKIY